MISLENTMMNSAVVFSASTGAYVSFFEITGITDGSKPFDLSDTIGNDSSEHNKIVRTFDIVNYSLNASFSSKTGENFNQALIGFEASIYKDLTEAEFSINNMLWLNDDWKIDFLDNKGNIVATKNENGMKDKDGKSITINSLVQDSTKGESSYKSGIVEQHLIGTYNLESKTQTVIPGTKTLEVAINVSVAKNGDTLEPKFKVYVVGNEKNIGINNQVIVDNVCEINSENEKTKENVVRISAKPRYNIMVRPNTDFDYKSYFNLETGNEEKERNVNTVLGRMLSYGITLQLYNETDNSANTNLLDKGLKGIELPKGEIAFDITITESENKSSEQINEEKYFPILWDYYENETIISIPDRKNKGYWNRNMYWNNEDRSPYAKGAAPYNKYHNGGFQVCYNGGKYTISETSKITTTDNLLEKARVYHVTVNGYDFDFDNYHYPTGTAGNSGTVSFLNKSKFAFSAGQIQLIMQFPEDTPETRSVYSCIKISNLKATSISNVIIDDSSDEQNNVEINYSDNSDTRSITFYAKGYATKGNLFTKDRPGDKPNLADTNNQRFLGTDYWNKSYDCSAYIGDKINLESYVMLNSKTDNRVKSFNLLQKFDTEAFEIDTSRNLYYYPAINYSIDTPGTGKFLYAADPLYPNGYNSNNKDDANRMNVAEEEDYIYFRTLEELKSKGYTCIGVLLEVRNADIMGGKYLHLKIPIKIKNNSSLIGKTVCTTNTANIWSDQDAMVGISWIDGIYDANKKKIVFKDI